MAYHLPTLRPLWNFTSDSRSCAGAPHLSSAPEALLHPVQSWTTDTDGRPRARWTVGQHRFLDA